MHRQQANTLHFQGPAARVVRSGVGPHQHDGVLLRAGLAAPQRERRGAARVGRRPLRLRLPVEGLELRAGQPRALLSLRVALVRSQAQLPGLKLSIRLHSSVKPLVQEHEVVARRLTAGPAGAGQDSGCVHRCLRGT